MALSGTLACLERTCIAHISGLNEPSNDIKNSFFNSAALSIFEPGQAFVSALSTRSKRTMKSYRSTLLRAVQAQTALHRLICYYAISLTSKSVLMQKRADGMKTDMIEFSPQRRKRYHLRH